MWKKVAFIFIIIAFMILTTFTDVHASGNITLTSGTSIKSKYGQLTVTKDMVMTNMIDYANGTTMLFNVTGYELIQHVYQFQLQSYGNGTLNIAFSGIIPIQVTANSALSKTYLFPSEKIQYNTATTTPVIVVYGTVYPQENKKVLFLDDFLQSPLLDNLWTIDLYQSPGINPGEYTSSGYALMYAKSTSSIETIHVTNAIFDPSSYSSGVIVKRKLTASLIPFTKLESPQTARIEIGFSSKFSSGTYPGVGPYGTPVTDNTNNCFMATGNPNDNIGTEYISMDTNGLVTTVTCGNPPGTRNNFSFSGFNPTLYTVFTVETSGLFCSSCIDHSFPGYSWVYFRIYQEDSSGSVISSTDLNHNFTSNVSPLYQQSYVFVSQLNNNGAATLQSTAIDLIQVQNYGSPVCLFGCIPPLDLPSNAFSSLWATLVSFCEWIGLGDLSFGAFILFGILESVSLAATYFVMNRFEGTSTLILVIEFMAISAIFLTSGLMGSVWLFAILITDALVALLTFRALFFSGSRGGVVSE